MSRSYNKRGKHTRKVAKRYTKSQATRDITIKCKIPSTESNYLDKVRRADIVDLMGKNNNKNKVDLAVA